MFSLLLLLLFYGFKLVGEEGRIDNVYARFERIITKEKSVEKTSGTIYFTLPGLVHAVVTSPVRQQLIVQDRTMTIYYPLEQKAFVIQSEHPLDLPFVNSFILGLRKDFGLSELGYQMDTYRLYGDTLETYWKQKSGKVLFHGSTMLKSIGKSLVSVQTHDSSQNSWSILSFDKFVQTPLGKPMASSLTRSVQTPREKYKEVILFDMLQFNTPFPDSIMRFELPPNTTIERINW